MRPGSDAVLAPHAVSARSRAPPLQPPRVGDTLDFMAPASLQSLATQIQFLGTLGRVLPWGLAVQPQWTVVDVVIQDEYTHDVLLGTDADARTLVLDCT